jgi:CDP-paratose 2-epimerase
MRILITGSSGLVGSEAVAYFDNQGHEILGIDNNMRTHFFGEKGDTLWNLERLKSEAQNFSHFALDIRDREKVIEFFKDKRPDAIIHCAAQPSHDWAASSPFDDFDVNATGTMNLIEATRQFSKESPFAFLSTNKVYGDSPNEIPLEETELRWDYARSEDYQGVSESCRIDHCKHSLFGASKVAADVMVQEYGRYFNMPTACFRGGCLTGPNHSGVELHGFLNYIVKVAVQGGNYTIFGYKGKQVRDQIHSIDVIRVIEAFFQKPRFGEAYNIGGGRQSNASILETINKISSLTGKVLHCDYSEKNRIGDHICYISDISKLKAHFPSWGLTRKFDDILEEMVEFEIRKLKDS